VSIPLEFNQDPVNPAAGGFHVLDDGQAGVACEGDSTISLEFNPEENRWISSKTFLKNFFQFFFGNIWTVQKYFVSLQCLQKRTGN